MRRARLTLASVAVASAAAAAVLGAGAAPAAGEFAEDGNLVATVDGDISPRKLPRDWRAPVAMRIASAFRTTDGDHVPQVRRARIDLHRQGRLITRGLGRCRERRIRNVSTQRARKRCGRALVGRGRVEAVIAFEDMEPLEMSGRLLAFNTRRGGRPAVIAHAFISDPVPVTYVVTFRLRRERRGPYGMSLVADFPRVARDQGYVTAFNLRLGRTFRHRGVRRSYLRAACSTPRGINVALFPLARTTFSFADGRELSTSLERTCRVRR